MLDFAEIDRRLDAIGRAPQSVEEIAGLLARHIGGDRSRDALDRMLAALGSEPLSVRPPASPVGADAIRDAIMSEPPGEAPALEFKAPLHESVPAPSATEPPTPDTAEFPRPPSSPAPAAVEATDASDDDFEMLIEDEEILEIQEDDVEEDLPQG